MLCLTVKLSQGLSHVPEMVLECECVNSRVVPHGCLWQLDPFSLMGL